MIKRVNPFILLGVLCIILLMLVLGVVKKESNIENQRSQNASYEAYAKNMQNLQKSWNQKKASSRISSIISSWRLKSAPSIKKAGNKIVVHMKNVNKNHANKAIKDLLNEPFVFKHFHIKRVDDKELEIRFEVLL